MVSSIKSAVFFPLFFLLFGVGLAAQAADPAIARFESASKSELSKMRTTINTAKKQRVKDSFQKSAARKYSINYDRTYSQMWKLRSSDLSKLKSGLRTSAGKSSVASAISRFEGRIEKLKKAQAVIDRDMSYCQIWCLRVVGHAAIWSGFVVSIPSLNVTPVMTFAR